MFIIKWLDNNGNFYYKFSYYNTHYIGFINQYGHEIIDINYIYNGRVWEYEQYKLGLCYKKQKNVFYKFIHTLNKLNK